MYRIISPSRTNKPPSPTHSSYGREVSGRRWRSAANRPSRQARRGWASLYKAHSLKKRTTSRVQQKFNSPKISSRESISHNAISQHQKTSPRSPEPTVGRPRAFSGQTRANLGQKWAIGGQKRAFSGRFWAFPGQNHAVFAPHFPLPGSPSAPGAVQKFHLPTRAPNRTSPTPISQNRTKYNIIITNSPKFTPLSL